MDEIERNASADTPERNRVLDALKLLGSVGKEIPSEQDAIFRITISDLMIDAGSRLKSGSDTAREQAVMILDARLPEIRATLRESVTVNFQEIRSSAQAVRDYIALIGLRHTEEIAARGKTYFSTLPPYPQGSEEGKKLHADTLLASMLGNMEDLRCAAEDGKERQEVHDYYERARIAVLNRQHFLEAKNRAVQLSYTAHVLAIVHILVREEVRNLNVINPVQDH